MLLPALFAVLFFAAAAQAKVITHTTTLVIYAYYDATADTAVTSTPTILSISSTSPTPPVITPFPTGEATQQVVDQETTTAPSTTSEVTQQIIQQATQQTIDQTSDQLTDHSADQPTSQPTSTIDQTSDQLTDHSTDQPSDQPTSQPTSTTTTTTLTTEPTPQSTSTLATHTNPTNTATPPATWIFPATATLLLYDLIIIALFVWCWIMGMFSWWKRDGRAGERERRRQGDLEDWTGDEGWDGWDGESERERDTFRERRAMEWRVEREMRRAGML